MNDLYLLAQKDYKAYRMLKDSADEDVFSISCYLMQQAIEKLLKSAIELKGKRPEWIHDIGSLYRLYKQLGYPEFDELDRIKDSLTLWESKSRYNINFIAEHKDLLIAEKAYHILDEVVSREFQVFVEEIPEETKCSEQPEIER